MPLLEHVVDDLAVTGPGVNRDHSVVAQTFSDEHPAVKEFVDDWVLRVRDVVDLDQTRFQVSSDIGKCKFSGLDDGLVDELRGVHETVVCDVHEYHIRHHVIL